MFYIISLLLTLLALYVLFALILRILVWFISLFENQTSFVDQKDAENFDFDAEFFWED